MAQCTVLGTLMLVGMSPLAHSVEISLQGWERRLAPISSNEGSGRAWERLDRGNQGLPREYRGFIDYRAHFNVPDSEQGTVLGLYVGQVGDVDRVFLNDQLIGQTGDFPPNYMPYLDIFREYVIPSDALIAGENLLRFETYVEYVGQKGIQTDIVTIAPHSELQRKKYLSELFWYLSRTGIPILCVFLSLISMPWLASKEQLRPNLLLFLTAFFYAIFGVGKSRVLFHFFPPLITYKLITLSALVGLIFVFIYALDLCRLKTKWLHVIAIGAPLVFAFRIAIGNDFGDTAEYVKDWLFGSVPLLAGVALVTVLRATRESIWVRIGIVFLAVVATNDVLNGTRIIRTANLMDYGFLGFVLAMMVSQMTRTKVGWVDLSKREADLLWSNRFMKQASQLAHDIRSPLSSMVPKLEELKSVMESNESVRAQSSSAIEVLEAGMNRMQAMASRVLTDFQSKFGGSAQIASAPRLTLIEKVISDVVLEVSSTASPTIKISQDGFPTVPERWAVVDVPEVQAAIANIMRNSIEVLSAGVSSPSISLKLMTSSDSVQLEIQDNGPGIPPEILPRIFEEGFTHGKPGGTGLGLFQAKNAIELNEGSLSFDSAVGRGTTVKITLPLEPKPSWVCESIEIAPKTPVVVVDDDISVLTFWRSKFAELSALRVSYFSSFGTVPADATKNAFIISDNDIKGDLMVGTEWLRKVPVFEGAVLCTSDYDDSKVQHEVKRLGLKILPKPQLSKVRLSVRG